MVRLPTSEPTAASTSVRLRSDSSWVCQERHSVGSQAIELETRFDPESLSVRRDIVGARIEWKLDNEARFARGETRSRRDVRRHDSIH